MDRKGISDMEFFRWYFNKERGLVKPSVSIRSIARLFYSLELAAGVIGAVTCLIMLIVGIANEEGFSFGLVLGIILVPLMAKLSGWLIALGLTSIAVVVESHEKQLGIEKEVIEPKIDYTSKYESKLSSFRMNRMEADKGEDDYWWCEYCGKKNASTERLCISCGKLRK